MARMIGRRAPRLLGAVLAASLGLTGAAQAQQPAYTGEDVNLRAGPGRAFPLISLIPPHRPAEIFGCVDEWGWCDVALDGLRGWVAGNKLRVPYEDTYVWLPQFAPRLGVPVIGFDFDTYWDSYYRGRPFFVERDRYRRYAPPEHGPERGGYGGPPQGGQHQDHQRPDGPRGYPEPQRDLNRMHGQPVGPGPQPEQRQGPAGPHPDEQHQRPMPPHTPPTAPQIRPPGPGNAGPDRGPPPPQPQ